MMCLCFLGSVQASTTLTVGTIERPPFAFTEYGELTGFSIELWEAIARDSNIPFAWKQQQQFSTMVDEAIAGKTDLAIANISMTSDREQRGDFSQPIFESGMAIAIKKDAEPSILQLIWDSGVLLFLGGALAILLVIAHILWFFERNVTDTRHDYFRDDYLGGVWDAFWWAFIIMTMGGFENEVPHKKFSRFLAMMWIIVSLFFISTITAKITTALTVAELQTDINGYRDLSGKRVGVTEGSSHQRFLGEKGIGSVGYATADEMYAELKRGELDAVVADYPVLSYYAQHEGLGWMAIAGQPFNLESYGLLFPQNSELVEAVNVALLKLRESGEYADLRKKYFGD